MQVIVIKKFKLEHYRIRSDVCGNFETGSLNTNGGNTLPDIAK